MQSEPISLSSVTSQTSSADQQVTHRLVRASSFGLPYDMYLPEPRLRPRHEYVSSSDAPQVVYSPDQQVTHRLVRASSFGLPYDMYLPEPRLRPRHEYVSPSDAPYRLVRASSSSGLPYDMPEPQLRPRHEYVSPSDAPYRLVRASSSSGLPYDMRLPDPRSPLEEAQRAASFSSDLQTDHQQDCDSGMIFNLSSPLPWLELRRDCVTASGVLWSLAAQLGPLSTPSDIERLFASSDLVAPATPTSAIAQAQAQV